MKRINLYFLLFVAITQLVFGQSNRIQYNNQQLFLSGVNLAWMSFANDIGPTPTSYSSFADFFLAIHDSGGNAVRWWLHTNGTNSPEFNQSNYVVGPGNGTIQDLKTILDIAWQREVGVILCLWSFDMLRASNPAPNPTVLTRNTLLLTDTSYTNTYIRNCLIPMVDSLKGHPAIIAWEIFNEPEGMSNEFGWSEINHVPMSTIQRFVNLCAGAIHRTDTSALVTNGTWSFKALTDLSSPSALIALPKSSALSKAEQEILATEIKTKYRLTTTNEEILKHLKSVATQANYNYYSDERLIAAGGDSDGTLDFYSVHYYEGIDPSNPTSISPFHHPATAWGLTKPIVVAEFHVKDIISIPKKYLYTTIYGYGYAGALAWSWTDNAVSQKTDMLSALKLIWDNYRSSVDVDGISGDYPNVSITAPANNAVFKQDAIVEIQADASDADGTVVLVEFFANDSIKIGESSLSPYSVTWRNITPNYYLLTAVATDNRGNKRTSKPVRINVGMVVMTKMEAEVAGKGGGGASSITIANDATASGGKYLDIKTNTAGTFIEWTFYANNGPGNFSIAFGYKLAYASPKEQYVNVNGVRSETLRFEAPTNDNWYEKWTTVNLVKGLNKIQMELFWGWMHLDYLAVENNAFTSVENIAEQPKQFSLEQNYPNPFNPTTNLEYQIANREWVTMKVYDILGREIATLVNEYKPAGYYQVEWNGKNDFGQSVASGVYFYRLQAGTFTDIKKMILIR